MATKRLTGLLGNSITSVMVTVQYDTDSDTVETVERITAVDNLLGKYIDITDVVMESPFEALAEGFIQAIQWRELSRQEEPAELIG